MVALTRQRYAKFVLTCIATALIVGCARTATVRGPESGAADKLAMTESVEGVPSSPAFEETPLIEAASDTDSPFFAPEEEVVAEEVVAEEVESPLVLDQPSNSELTDLRIAQGASDNEVVAEVPESIDFEVRKTAPSEFVISLPGVSFDEDLILPALAGGAEGSIRSVRAARTPEGTELRIFAKPEIALNIEREEGILKAIPSDNPSVLLDDVRANTPSEEFTASALSELRAQVSDGSSRDVDSVAQILTNEPKYTGRLISLDLQDTDIDNALRIIAEVSNLNIIASEDVQGKVTLRLIDVPWDQALDVILKTNGLDKVREGNVVRIAPVEKLRAEREALKQAKMAEEELEPLQVKFIRVSYARASDLKPLIDNVLSERGAATFDERTNQLIVKDIGRGVRNVVELIQKLDLRTPQILLETQIVEAQRTLLRELGSQFGFNYIQSAETGNATGESFPSSVDFNGGFTNAGAGLNPINLLLGSADGTKLLSAQLTALEQEGDIRIVSRPAVATTNNKQALIKSVEKVRIRLPAGGVSVATGQGASAAGQGQAATETIEIGITLEVTPQASPDFYVLLDINAKSSTFGANETDGIPSEVERSATSSVLVSSGQTFALGGIYKLTNRDAVEGVPFFKDIPVLGTLFRLTSIDNSDEELLFFITPRIVEGSFDDSTMQAMS